MSDTPPILRAPSRWRRRRPYVRQHDESDCGPAALVAVLRYWNGDAPLAHVRDLAGTDGRGTTLAALAAAARALGFEAMGATGEYDDLREAPLPCIAHIVTDDQLSHYVVVHEVGADAVRIVDPAKGRRTMRRADFERQWTERAVLLLTPTESLVRRDVPSWWRIPLSVLRGEETWISQSVFLGTIYTLLGLTTSVLVQAVIDRFIPQRNARMLVATAAALGAVQAARLGAGYVRQRMIVSLNLRFSQRLTATYLEHLFHLPLRFFSSRRRGDITARLQDIGRIQSAVVRLLGTVVTDVVIVAGSLGILVLLAAPLVGLIVGMLLLYAAVSAYALRSLYGAQHDVLQRYAAVESTYIDSLQGIHAISSFAVTETFVGRCTRAYGRFQETAAGMARRQAALSLGAEAIGSSLIVAALIYGAYLVIGGELLLGQLVAAYSLLSMTLTSTSRLIEGGFSLQSASVATTRLADLLHAEREQQAGTGAPVIERLELRGARHEWTPGSSSLEGVDLTLRRGTVTALWGPSGAGKSTLVHVLTRQYSLHDGELLVNGMPASAVALASYREQVAVVPEHVPIFRGTLMDNVLLGRTLDEPQRLHRLLRRYGLHPLLERFADGILTLVGEEGRQLSAGERQIVGLLRALVAEPSVLIVDEGLNAIDVDVGRLIMQALRTYANDHAVLLISHNVRVVTEAEHLYVLEDGRITAAGSPHAILSQRPGFARPPAVAPAGASPLSHTINV